MAGRAGTRYRRSPSLTLSWANVGLVCLDCRTGKRYNVPAEGIAFLALIDGWSTVAGLVKNHPEVGDAASARRLLEWLRARRLVERDDEASLWPWEQWTPDASAYHFGTRNGEYPRDPLAHDVTLVAKAKHSPLPPPTKTVAGKRIRLPKPSDVGALSTTLLNRRTWRNFGTTKLSMSSLATLLQLTWGVQKWGRVKGQGLFAFKTSPSGGARHPIEAYVLARNVDGLRAGAYHYDASRHRLVDLRRSVTREGIQELLGHQYYFAGASAVVVMAAVFGRTMWKYPSSRVYRSILIEAGHLGQTFCLLATAMGLAPFGTIAFQDQKLDNAIGIDGINEGSLYAVGVGTRPRRATNRPGRIRGAAYHAG